MHRYAFLMMTLLGLTTMLPLRAQNNAQPTFRVGITVDGNGVVTRQMTPTPDAVVARLMSFDANHDGRVTREELPERMRGVFARVSVNADGSLDGAAVRRLAMAPVAPSAAQGLQPGHYGFGDDNDLDTRLHIEGAIEDLRLASNTRDEALGIGRKFIDTVKGQAKTELLAAVEPLLTVEQFADFKATVDQPARQVVMPNLVTLPPNASGPQVEAMRAMLQRSAVFSRRANLTRVAAKYSLPPASQKTMLSALQRFEAHDRLSDVDRSALLGQLQGVLSAQERDDLRAALERRPIVKQGGAAGTFAISRVAIPQQSITVVPPRLGVQDLVLHR